LRIEDVINHAEKKHLNFTAAAIAAAEGNGFNVLATIMFMDES
jgi:hypothetical protein